ncbi:MAG: class I SAM-dependent methyltransferase [Candidatus Omnitrophica bacterium]|nr:class I SAM-dependent methyltransferase [Candidatus Omnitrophota bacterium]
MRLYRCSHCDHTFTVVDTSYADKKIYSDAYFDSSHENWFKFPNFPLFDRIHKFILKSLKNNDFKLLDIGCGRGDLLNYLHQKEPKWDLYGIDTSTQKSDNFKFIQADFAQSSFNQKFDVVTSIMCIEHIQDINLFVDKIIGITKPEGLIIITTINAGGLMYGLARALHKIGISQAFQRLYSEHHVQHFTNKSLKALLENHGLCILSQKNPNYRLASVDYPKTYPLISGCYKIATAITFGLSTLLNNGVSQEVMCKRV